MSIVGLLEQIKNDEIVLPAIQRGFVWDEEKIEKLLDSIMRGYPIGIILLWETYDDIQYRYFSRDYKPGVRYTFHDNSQQRRLKLVLDGQQRLQSLYIALYGVYKGKYLYFDVLSGRETEDFEEDKFMFRFFTPEKAEKLNQIAISEAKKDSSKKGELYFYCKVQDLLAMGVNERHKFQHNIAKKLKLGEEEEVRLGMNLSILREALTSDTSIIRATVLDENKPRDSPDRKSESDVLEAFVRINREGTPLSRSDLIFSMLKLNWKESAETLPEFVYNINEGNSFELDSDFVIRCLFAVSDLGTRFDINILRKKSNITIIRQNFERCCDAIRSTVDFVQNECWIASSELLGGYYNLVPFVYYLFHTPDHQVPNSEIEKVRKAVYLFGFTSPFSRYADSRLGAIIREEFRPLVEKHDVRFPLKGCVSWIQYWENIEEYGPQLLQNNPSLVLHLIQRRSGAKVHYDKNAPQIDHIFPQSVLRKKGYDESKINHFANFWILAKNKNQNKSAKDPKEYFKDVSDSILKQAYIDRKLLDYKKFRIFLKIRERKILNHVKRELKLSKYDFMT
jgi:uncharacterized protein with ParB-like and HNH nuclease domain